MRAGIRLCLAGAAAALLLLPSVPRADRLGGGLSPAPPLRPSVVAPYRLNPPPAPLPPLAEQKALAYRAALEGQRRELHLEGLGRRLDLGRFLIERDTRAELDRLDRALAR